MGATHPCRAVARGGPLRERPVKTSFVQFAACLSGDAHSFHFFFADDLLLGRRIEPRAMLQLRAFYMVVAFVGWFVGIAVMFALPEWTFLTLVMLLASSLFGVGFVRLLVHCYPRRMHVKRTDLQTFFVQDLLFHAPQLRGFYEANSILLSRSEFELALLHDYAEFDHRW